MASEKTRKRIVYGAIGLAMATSVFASYLHSPKSKFGFVRVSNPPAVQAAPVGKPGAQFGKIEVKVSKLDEGKKDTSAQAAEPVPVPEIPLK